MQKVIVDSDIVIDFTRAAKPLLRNLFKQQSSKKLKLFVPSVVVTELISGRETRQEPKLKLLEELLKKMEYVTMDYDISKGTGVLLRDNQPIELADAIVASTALSLNAKLATRNKKHFATVKNLKFFKLNNLSYE